VQASAEPNLFELCRVQPKIMNVVRNYCASECRDKLVWAMPSAAKKHERSS